MGIRIVQARLLNGLSRVMRLRIIDSFRVAWKSGQTTSEVQMNNYISGGDWSENYGLPINY